MLHRLSSASRFLLLLTVFILTSQARAQEEINLLDRVKFSGEFRFRQDYSSEELSPTEDEVRFRSRIRLKLGADIKIHENVKVITQLVTADSPGSSATSGNQSLDNAGEKKATYFDLAYANILTEEFELNAGKMKNPIYRAGNSELLWDTDFTPEGLSAKYTLDLGSTKLALLGFGFWMKERNNNPAANGYTDAGALGGQLLSTTEMEAVKLAVYVGSNDFTNLKGKTALRGSGYENSVDGSNAYLLNYHVLNAGFSLGLTAIPLEIYADAAENTGASEQSKAIIAGVVFGKLKEEGDWSIGYNWREAQNDSTVGGLNDSDFSNGELNTRGHVVTAGYAFTEAIQTRLTLYQSKLLIDGAQNDYLRGFLDFTFKF